MDILTNLYIIGGSLLGFILLDVICVKIMQHNLSAEDKKWLNK